MRDEEGLKKGAPRAKSKRANGNKSSSLTPRPSSLPLVAVVMGSKSDWETMRHADEVLTRFGVAHECRVVSAHRTPGWMADFAVAAEGRGLKVIIAGAGGAAHLPGMIAAHTTVPVFGVPVESRVLRGLDSLLSIVQMPAGVPVGTLAIGQAGATNAALLAVAVLANEDEALREALREFRREQERQVREATLQGQG
jgi:5-(carboxyamino)imidazole ribonucleotide mutase